MRELTVRLRFTKHCLGNVKGQNGAFLLPKSPGGSVTFLATWHRANMVFAAQILGKHQDEVRKILWDVQVDGSIVRDCWYRRYYAADGKKSRHSLHESFVAGQVVGVNCVVPAAVSDDDLWRLMTIAGQYRGISPFKPGEFGFFTVESVRPRRAAAPVRPAGEVEDQEGEENTEARPLPAVGPP